MAQFSSTVTVAKEYGLIGANSQYDLVTVGTTATLIDLAVDGRTSVFLQAHKDLVDVLYIGLDDTVSDAKHFASLTAGEKIQFIVSTSSNPAIYVKGTNATDKVAVLEGVN